MESDNCNRARVYVYRPLDISFATLFIISFCWLLEPSLFKYLVMVYGLMDKFLFYLWLFPLVTFGDPILHYE